MGPQLVLALVAAAGFGARPSASLADGPAGSEKSVPTIHWRHSFAEARAEAQERNAVLYIAFTQDSDNVILSTVFEDPGLVEYCEERVVMIAAHPVFKGPLPHEPESYRDPDTRAKRSRCPIYKTITCKEHQHIARELSGLLDPDSTPCEFMLDGRTHILFDGRRALIDGNAFAPERYLTALRAAQKSLGRVVSRTLYDQLLQAESSLNTRRYAEGLGALKKVLRKMSRLPRSMRKRIEELKIAFETAGEAKLVEARRLRDAGEVAKARALLDEIVKQFPGTKTERTARLIRGGLT